MRDDFQATGYTLERIFHQNIGKIFHGVYIALNQTIMLLNVLFEITVLHEKHIYILYMCVYLWTFVGLDFASILTHISPVVGCCFLG